ncbi:MAG: hypothetical protein LBF40_08105 [Deltaproteobacteria bacterium]|jgi:hypothetical protein|nr:hypothetical protein [Deltaproteobacteria bacterium]
MKTFSELLSRLSGLCSHMDGELWDRLLSELNPPASYPPPSGPQDLAFRDVLALSGYAPDLRRLLEKNPPKGLDPSEKAAFIAVMGYYSLAARIPVLLLGIDEHKGSNQLMDLWNGFRQLLAELAEYRGLAEGPREA